MATIEILHDCRSYSEMFANLRQAGYDVDDPAEIEREVERMIGDGATVNSVRAMRGLRPIADGNAVANSYRR